MKYPKVLVGAPVSNHHEYCIDKFIKSLKTLTYPNFDILLVDNSKTNEFYNKIKDIFPTIKYPYHKDVKVRLAKSRNILREKTINEGYDYMFNLDQDVVPPKDIIERLMSHKKEITTGVYFNKFSRIGKNLTYETKTKPVLWVQSPNHPEDLVFVRNDIIAQNKLIRVDLCGTGCILIHRDVLEKIQFRWEENETGVDDSFFCIDAAKLGYKIYADTSIKCTHHIDKRPLDWGAEDLKT